MTEKLPNSTNIYDTNINTSIYDDAPLLDDDFFRRANLYQGNKLVRLGNPPKANPKQAITVHYDSDIIDRFRATGKGWQTRMNDALREYLDTHAF